MQEMWQSFITSYIPTHLCLAVFSDAGIYGSDPIVHLPRYLIITMKGDLRITILRYNLECIWPVKGDT